MLPAAGNYRHAIDGYRTVRHCFQPLDQPENSGFPGSAGTDQRHLFSVEPEKVRSLRVIIETKEVDFNNSTSRLPSGGSIKGKACGNMMRRNLP